MAAWCALQVWNSPFKRLYVYHVDWIAYFFRLLTGTSSSKISLNCFKCLFVSPINSSNLSFSPSHASQTLLDHKPLLPSSSSFQRDTISLFSCGFFPLRLFGTWRQKREGNRELSRAIVFAKQFAVFPRHPCGSSNFCMRSCQKELTGFSNRVLNFRSGKHKLCTPFCLSPVLVSNLLRSALLHYTSPICFNAPHHYGLCKKADGKKRLGPDKHTIQRAKNRYILYVDTFV